MATITDDKTKDEFTFSQVFFGGIYLQSSVLSSVIAVLFGTSCRTNLCPHIRRVPMVFVPYKSKEMRYDKRFSLSLSLYLLFFFF